MIPAAAGATTPKVCTCAMTSCLLFFSSSAVISNCFRSRCYTKSPQGIRDLEFIEQEGEGRTRLFFICSMASSGIGSPSSFSAMARLSHSFRQVWCRFCQETLRGPDSELCRETTDGSREKICHLFASISAIVRFPVRSILARRGLWG
jgi:hypothetical protein